MDEDALLRRIRESSQSLPPPIMIGPGDDAAVLRACESCGSPSLLVTVDQLVEGRHYDANSATIDQVARKAIARSVSDIAAMGGRPRAAFAAASMRSGFEQGEEFFDAMVRWAKRWGCPLAGGDIAVVDGPGVVSVTVIGETHRARGAVLRTGAKPGDGVYVTGSLGGSLASGRHLSFEPRLEEASSLCDELGERLTAMIDLSDGLGRDAARLAAASGLRLELKAEAIPTHEDVADWRAAACDGEDYELCFTVTGEGPQCTFPDAPITRIGRVCKGVGCVVITPDGMVVDVSELGWDHGEP